jgi:hypothetical protein
MSKTEMTWLGLIKLKLAELKKEGKSPSIGDVTPVARKEWAEIKAGTHPKYIQGKAQTFARKKHKKNKTMKKGSSASSSTTATDLEDILNNANVKLCAKCKKNLQKALNKKSMKGGQEVEGGSEVEGGNEAAAEGGNEAAAEGGGKCNCSKKKKMMKGGCGCMA